MIGLTQRRVTYSDSYHLWVSERPGHFIVKKPFTVKWDSPRGLISFTVEVDFETDLASRPKILRTIFGLFDQSAQISIAHDWIYTGHTTLSKKEADLCFKHGLEAAGMPAWRVACMYWAVRRFGVGHWS